MRGQFALHLLYVGNMGKTMRGQDSTLHESSSRSELGQHSTGTLYCYSKVGGTGSEIWQDLLLQQLTQGQVL